MCSKLKFWVKDWGETENHGVMNKVEKTHSALSRSCEWSNWGDCHTMAAALFLITVGEMFHQQTWTENFMSFIIQSNFEIFSQIWKDISFLFLLVSLFCCAVSRTLTGCCLEWYNMTGLLPLKKIPTSKQKYHSLPLFLTKILHQMRYL